jgi:hypothetical protein
VAIFSIQSPHTQIWKFIEWQAKSASMQQKATEHVYRNNMEISLGSSKWKIALQASIGGDVTLGTFWSTSKQKLDGQHQKRQNTYSWHKICIDHQKYAHKIELVSFKLKTRSNFVSVHAQFNSEFPHILKRSNQEVSSKTFKPLNRESKHQKKTQKSVIFDFPHFSVLVQLLVSKVSTRS